ncbi:MAG: sulfotransferase domain-containing protein [Elusimicrobiota bacterium]
MRTLYIMHARPSFIVIGAQKAGTTALFQNLSRHPRIAPPIEKEIDFFSCGGRFRRGIDFYHSHFPTREALGAEGVTYDVSPDYMVSPEAARRIFEYDPKMKLIAVLRDPVSRAYLSSPTERNPVQSHRSGPTWFERFVV